MPDYSDTSKHLEDLLKRKLSHFHEEFARHVKSERQRLAQEISKRNLVGQSIAIQMSDKLEKELCVQKFRGFKDSTITDIDGIGGILTKHYESYPSTLVESKISELRLEFSQGWERQLSSLRAQKKSEIMWGPLHAERAASAIEQDYRSIYTHEWNAIELKLKEIIARRNIENSTKQAPTQVDLSDVELKRNLQRFFDEYYSYSAHSKEAFRQEHADKFHSGYWIGKYFDLAVWHVHEMFHGYIIEDSSLCKSQNKPGLIESAKSHFDVTDAKLDGKAICEIVDFVKDRTKNSPSQIANVCQSSLALNLPENETNDLENRLRNEFDKGIVELNQKLKAMRTSLVKEKRRKRNLSSVLGICTFILAVLGFFGIKTIQDFQKSQKKPDISAPTAVNVDTSVKSSKTAPSVEPMDTAKSATSVDTTKGPGSALKQGALTGEE